MKKSFRILSAALAGTVLLSTSALACTGVYVGKDVSDQGTYIIARSEDQGQGDYNKMFMVQPRVENVPGRYIEDTATGFKIPLPDTTYKYTYVPDYTRGDDGMYPGSCTNEYGVSISATVSTSTCEAWEKADPFVEPGLREAILAASVAAVSTNAREAVARILNALKDHCGDVEAAVRMTGSVGMGFAETHSLPFVQEVVAATKAVQRLHPETASLIDIGGEDAKVVFFNNGRASDLRMNGNCAGGTGAFIDQMAVLLGIGIDELDGLAAKAVHTYPIASRCGVFCKTDIQNLIAKNASRADIAASILHAVAVQTVVTLAHGCEIKPPVLMCGGPLTFIPSLRKAFKDYLSLSDNDIILPEEGTLLPALGAALAEVDGEQPRLLSAVMAELAKTGVKNTVKQGALRPIFADEREYSEWKARMGRHKINRQTEPEGKVDALLGIDSGSDYIRSLPIVERHVFKCIRISMLDFHLARRLRGVHDCIQPPAGGCHPTESRDAGHQHQFGLHQFGG